MKKTLTSILIAGTFLAGCDSPNGMQQGGNLAAAPAEIAPSVQKPQHAYSMKDGYEYGYEPGISQDQQNAGQVAATLMMFKYAGQKDGFYQTYSQDADGAIVVAECSNPCEFIKMMVFFNGEHIRSERLKATEGTIGWLTISDAINGKLEQYVGEKNGKKFHLWFDEKKGMSITPI